MAVSIKGFCPVSIAPAPAKGRVLDVKRFCYTS